MKTQFETLKNKSQELSVPELMEEVQNLVTEILKSDSVFYSIDKYRSGYGTWKTKGFANEYNFGNELAEILVNALSTGFTHDEEKEFVISDFEESLNELIYESLD